MTDQPAAPFIVDAAAARRWAARAPAASPWLHEEVARRMAARLDIIRLPVQRWAHWEPLRSGLQGQALVAARYPRAQCLRISAAAGPDAPAAAPNAAPPPAAARWWQRLGGAARAAANAAGAAGPAMPAPPDGAVQLVWANMLAHQHADARALLAAWHRALAADGFVMFSCLGPDTLKELRALYARLGWPAPAQPFVDMHDWGDALLAAGFADPVVDMETLTLTFDTPARLLAELRELGRNLHPGRFAALRTPRWRQRLLAGLDSHLRPPGGGPLSLSFELIYGHALKPAPRHSVSAETTIPLDALRAHLRRPKAG